MLQTTVSKVASFELNSPFLCAFAIHDFHTQLNIDSTYSTRQLGSFAPCGSPHHHHHHHRSRRHNFYTDLAWLVLVLESYVFGICGDDGTQRLKKPAEWIEQPKLKTGALVATKAAFTFENQITLR